MRVAQFTLSILVCVIVAFASETREFNLPTLEKLGNELSHRDEIAAKASDLIFEKHPEFKNITLQGWITDLHPDEDVVYFIVEANDAIAPAYKVIFPREGIAAGRRHSHSIIAAGHLHPVQSPTNCDTFNVATIK